MTASTASSSVALAPLSPSIPASKAVAHKPSISDAQQLRQAVRTMLMGLSTEPNRKGVSQVLGRSLAQCEVCLKAMPKSARSL